MPAIERALLVSFLMSRGFFVLCLVSFSAAAVGMCMRRKILFGAIPEVSEKLNVIMQIDVQVRSTDNNKRWYVSKTRPRKKERFVRGSIISRSSSLFLERSSDDGVI